MSLIKKIALICICFNVVFLSTKCGEPDLPIMDDEVIPENYYGDVLGYAKEVGDVEVIAHYDERFGDCYSVVDFSYTSKQNKILIIPDYIDGLPVYTVGLSSPISYDILPDGSAIGGLREYDKVKVPLTDPDTGEEVKDKYGKTKYQIKNKWFLRLYYGSDYLYYLDYPQFDNTGTLDALYISSFQISNFLPFLFLNFSDESKIVFNTSFFSNDSIIELFPSNNTYPENWSRLLYPYILTRLLNLYRTYDGDNIYDTKSDLNVSKDLNFYKYDWDNFKPIFVFSKADYFSINYILEYEESRLTRLIEKNDESYIEQMNEVEEIYAILSHSKCSNVSYKYNLVVNGENYNNFKASFQYYDQGADISYMLNECSDYNLYKYHTYPDSENYICSLSDFLNKFVIGYYWFDYNEEGDLLMEPPTPYVEGYEFLGWYKDSECTEEWNFEIDRVHFEEGSEEITLYAKWK